jgi:hypothetical protein
MVLTVPEQLASMSTRISALEAAIKRLEARLAPRQPDLLKCRSGPSRSTVRTAWNIPARPRHPSYRERAVPVRASAPLGRIGNRAGTGAIPLDYGDPLPGN